MGIPKMYLDLKFEEIEFFLTGTYDVLLTSLSRDNGDNFRLPRLIVKGNILLLSIYINETSLLFILSNLVCDYEEHINC